MIPVSSASSNFHIPDWNAVEQASVVSPALLAQDAKHVVLPLTVGHLHVRLYEFGVRFTIEDVALPKYNLLDPEPEPGTCEVVVNSDAQTEIHSGEFQLHIEHAPFSFRLIKNGRCVQQTANDGHFVRRFRMPPLAKVAEGWLLSLELAEQEPVYGLGEKWGKLDKRGQFVRSYNQDALGVNAEASYKNTPFAWSPNGWGVFVHTPSPVTHAVGYGPWSQRSYTLLVEDSQIDLFIFAQPNGQKLIKTYCELTGFAPVPPTWSLGVILSKAYYKDEAELLSTANAVRANNMPCDVITLDGRAWQDTDTRFAFEWDASRYKEPAETIRKLKEQHFKVCIWEYPLVSVQHPLFAQMEEKGWLLTDKRTGGAFRYQWDMSAFAEVLTPLPESGIVDFTHPEAFAFWLESHKPLFDIGVDMIKADFGEQVEDENMLAHNGDSGHRLHNVYSRLYNECVYQAAQKYSQNGPFLFSRSSWIGCQRFPSQWGGDPQADWGGLSGSIRGALSWGMSGAPYFATDVGGFYKDTRDPELFVRWSQAAVFSAHMRLHGIGQREPWSYGEQASKCVSEALTLRYQLIPYIHQTMQQASETGMPVMRGMALAFPEDKLSWGFDLQFMLGDDLLVVPCTQAGGGISFYLPKGKWQRYPNGEAFAGGQLYELTLPLNEMAVFVPENKIIPLGPAVEHTEQLKGQAAIASYWQAGKVTT